MKIEEVKVEVTEAIEVYDRHLEKLETSLESARVAFAAREAKLLDQIAVAQGNLETLQEGLDTLDGYVELEEQVGGDILGEWAVLEVKNDDDGFESTFERMRYQGMIRKAAETMQFYIKNAKKTKLGWRKPF